MIETKIIKNPISELEYQELLLLEQDNFGIIKATIDIEKEIISLNCELHCDCAEKLYEIGCNHQNVGGINIYPHNKTIEYLSLINIRPQIGNRSMEIQNEEIKEKINIIVNKLIFNFK